MKKALLVFAAVILLTSGSQAFDEQREGFVMGFGGGFSPITRVGVAGSHYAIEGTGFAANLFLGSGTSDKSIFGVELNMTHYKHDRVDFQLYFTGGSWYYYFRSQAPSMYFNLGLGVNHIYSNRIPTTHGLAVLLGSGINFADHWQVGLSLSLGRSSSGGGSDYDSRYASIIIDYFAF